MLAEYTIKMTLDNGDSFAAGMIFGIIVTAVLFCVLDYMDKK